MAEIVNLRQQRKARARAQAAAEAAENRVRHGRTKAERESSRLQAQQDRQRLNAQQLETSKPDPLRRDEPGE